MQAPMTVTHSQPPLQRLRKYFTSIGVAATRDKVLAYLAKKGYKAKKAGG